jgi:outer membrane receptor protein involved in Fe transport
VEAGFDWRPLSTARLSVTGYANEIRGAIANITLGRGPGTFPQVGFVAAGGSFRQRGNLEAIRVWGVEADAGLEIGDWQAQASLALADPRVRDPGSALDGLRPAATPNFAASATLGYTAGRVAAAVTLRHSGSQFEDDQNLRRLAAATTLDATLRVGIGAGLTVEARAENLTDTEVVSGISADGQIDRAQPRTLWLGLRWAG